MRRSLEASAAGGQALGAAAALLIARSLGPAGRGTLAALTLWAQVLGWLATGSVDKAVAVLPRRTESTVGPIYRHAKRIVLVGVLVVGPPATIVGIVAFRSVPLGLLLGIGICLHAWFELRASLLLVDRRLRRYAAALLAQPVSYFIGTVTIVILMRSESTHLRLLVIAIMTIGSIVSAVAFTPRQPEPGGTANGSRWFLIKHLFARLRPANKPVPSGRTRLSARPQSGSGHPPQRDSSPSRRAILMFGLQTQAGTMLQFLNGRLDLLVVSVTFASARLGIYSVAAATGQAIVLLGSAAMARGLSGDTNRRDVPALAALAVLAGAGIVLAPLALPWIFGQDYTESVPLAQILLAGGFFGFAAAGPCGRLLGLGLPRRVTMAQGAGVLTFATGVALRPHSLTAIAVSSAVSYAITLAVAEVLLLSVKPPLPVDQVGQSRRRVFLPGPRRGRRDHPDKVNQRALPSDERPSFRGRTT